MARAWRLCTSKCEKGTILPDGDADFSLAAFFLCFFLSEASDDSEESEESDLYLFRSDFRLHRTIVTLINNELSTSGKENGKQEID